MIGRSLRAVVDYWARRLWAEGGFPWPDCNDLTGLVAFLAGGLDWIAAQDWVGELVADVTRASRTAHRLVPCDVAFAELAVLAGGDAARHGSVSAV